MAATIGLRTDGKFNRTMGECTNVQGEDYSDGLQKWIEDYEWKNSLNKPDGLPLPLEFAPHTVRLTKGNELFDATNYIGMDLLYSERFRQAVEDIEPGVHQFLPVKVIGVDGDPYPGQWWSFRICQLIDAVNPVLGGLRRQDPGYAPPDEYTWVIKTGWRKGDPVEPDDSDVYCRFALEPRKKLAVYKDRIVGRAAWWDSRHRRIFFSDELMARIEQDGLEGFEAAEYWHEL